MKIINYIGYLFLSLLLSVTVFYIIGSFGSGDTNIKLWSDESRGFLAFGILIATIALSVILINYSIQEDKKSTKKEY